MINNYKRGEHDNRPWGTWEVIDCGKGFCVKRITVNPQGILSLQLHHFRSEHWIIVNGTATVTLGEDVIEKSAGEAVYIEKETKHRVLSHAGGTRHNKDAAFIHLPRPPRPSVPLPR
jgi:mannose-6-phosphate isomerase-like protein (cupin superfamily)